MWSYHALWKWSVRPTGRCWTVWTSWSKPNGVRCVVRRRKHDLLPAGRGVVSLGVVSGFAGSIGGVPGCISPLPAMAGFFDAAILVAAILVAAIQGWVSLRYPLFARSPFSCGRPW